jgi:hypothetical protein
VKAMVTGLDLRNFLFDMEYILYIFPAYRNLALIVSTGSHVRRAFGVYDCRACWRTKGDVHNVERKKASLSRYFDNTL